jgi:hypothetical protein
VRLAYGGRGDRLTVGAPAVSVVLGLLPVFCCSERPGAAALGFCPASCGSQAVDAQIARASTSALALLGITSSQQAARRQLPPRFGRPTPWVLGTSFLPFHRRQSCRALSVGHGMLSGDGCYT